MNSILPEWGALKNLQPITRYLIDEIFVSFADSDYNHYKLLVTNLINQPVSNPSEFDLIAISHFVQVISEE
jgi:hypothetical protein